MKTILQHDQRDCGAACLAMICSYHGLKLPISKCRELTKTDRTGANLYGLVDGAKQVGLHAEALSGVPEELMQGIEAGEICFPFIAHTVSEGGLLHYVVVSGLEHDRFLVSDPGKGKLRLTPEEFFERWTGYVVTFTRTNRFRIGNQTRGGFIKFFRLLKGQYTKLAGVLALSLVIAVIGILGAFVFQIVIDDFATDAGYYETQDAHDHGTAEEGDGHVCSDEEGALEHLMESVFGFIAGAGFHAVFVALILLYLLQAVIQFLRGYLIALVSKRIDIRLSLAYYNHIVDMPVSSIALRQTGEYLSRFSDTSTIRLAISGTVLTLLLDSLMVAASGYILFVENHKLFCVALLMVVFYAVIVLAYRKPVERSNRRVMENNALLQSYFKESIDGMETVKAACANGHVKTQTTSRFDRFIQSVFRNSLLSMSQDTLAGTVELIGTVVILWLGFAMVLARQVTVGSLITFYALLSYFTEPIKNLIELQPTIQTAIVAADRLNDVLDLEKEPEQGSGEALPRVDCWEFRNVDFRYGNRELTLKDVSLTVRRGEKIAIVGESGSGKTTLAKLLLRFYEPERGDILVNGKDIRDFELAELRKSVAYVDQNTFLFSDTIRNNLRLGNETVTDQEIERACADSRADEFIRLLPLGYDMPLDENGMNLSGGQRQRLAIARALLKRPQLLILDEATSNLDTITETAIKNTIFGLDEEMTCIIIAHRLTTVRNCDRICVMEQGKIAEIGTHEELMELGGRYAALWNSQ